MDELCKEIRGGLGYTEDSQKLTNTGVFKRRVRFMGKKPVLVVMAAGMGSRYGGLKQIDPIDQYGNIIMDFSIHDAVEAGFEKVIFIIKKAIEKDFKENVGKRMESRVQVEYVYQEIDKVPEGFHS